jgi:hypothetical protein
MTEKKSDVLKNIMMNIGLLFILVGSAVGHVDLVFFFLALAILAIQTFEFSGVNPRKLVVAEIMRPRPLPSAR